MPRGPHKVIRPDFARCPLLARQAGESLFGHRLRMWDLIVAARHSLVSQGLISTDEWRALETDAVQGASSSRVTQYPKG